ncbi:sugar phosphate nucleotidyltransferase [Legionella cardiaca]|uniref:NTP transferase domain-containing protein n=1 Tax=Legionella cardiaca TaxID=1071983 RepID=A0ABY8AQM5_9GAMM|nr:sugar phosphate nucleotidyltransferase [Legionella cardiaca]WED42823.1 NTP transferase domain-containing protein [Legionella cardiaca]
MKAVILAAGHGSRLFPYTSHKPKALLNINNMTILEWQLWQFMQADIMDFIVVTGFMHEDIERTLRRYQLAHPQIRYEVLFNQDYACAENIVSCLTFLKQYQNECILVNGDVLFHPQLVEQLISSAKQDINLLYDVKAIYDEDDMKITKKGNYLAKIGKTISAEFIDGESVGMIFLSAQGAKLFYQEICELLTTSANRQNWYLKAIDSLARKEKILLVRTPERAWCEIDYPKDLTIAIEFTKNWPQPIIKQSRYSLEVN